MTRWHFKSCRQPLVSATGREAIPACISCGSSARETLERLRQQPASSTFPPTPPDEPNGQLGLRWPPIVRYTREDEDSPRGEPLVGDMAVRDPQKEPATTTCPETQQKTETAPTGIYETTLATTEFRLICLSAAASESQPVNLWLETHLYDDCPEYEATSYTWAGEDGDCRLWVQR